MKRPVFLLIAAAMIGAGYYINYVYTSVSKADQMACEEAFRQQFQGQPDTAEKFLHQCRNPAMIAAGKANAGELGGEEAAEIISSANRNNLIKTILGFGLMGGGIGAIGAAFTRKKKVT